jgi:hypothetical protein
MSIVSITASATGFATQQSAYGSTGWSSGSNLISSSISQGQGTSWAVWAVQTNSVTAGQVFNGLKVTGTNDFTVGAGGVGKTRQATLYVKLLKTFSFTGIGGNNVQTLVASGVGSNLTTSQALQSLTSDDIRAGNCFFGVAVSTDTNDSGQGNGTFRYAALNFTVYTGVDSPFSEPTVTTTLTNPGNNVTPGKTPGGQFEAATFALTAPIPTTLFTMTFTLTGGLTFVSNGAGSLSLNKGANVDGYSASTGLIAIPSGTAPGVQTLSATIGGLPGGNGFKTGSLVVIPAYYDGFMEA